MSSTGDGAVTAGTGRREQLLTAAREVLAQHGYERTTVSSIATKASVAQGTFYLYFPSKEALPGALADQMAQRMGTAAEAAAEEATLAAGVERLVQDSYLVADGFSDVLIIANRGVELCADFEGWLAVTAPWRAGIERFLQHYKDDGQIDASLDVETTAFVVRDLLDRASKARVLFNQKSYADATIGLLHRALVH